MFKIKYKILLRKYINFVQKYIKKFQKHKHVIKKDSKKKS